MALNQANKLVWIVETIYRAHKISFEELNRRWMDNVDLSRGEEMLKRTFHKWKWNIFDTFGLLIDCEKATPYRYYIANEDDMKSGSIGNWLLSTLSVSNFLLEKSEWYCFQKMGQQHFETVPHQRLCHRSTSP